MAFGLAWLITGRYALRTERQMRDFVYGALGRYVSPDIADQVFRNVALMRPQRREVTLCYADLEGFRRLDRTLPPEVLVDSLNAYFGELTHLVRQTGGHVEYVGDALIAFWGAPVRLDRHGQVACRTALAIRAELDRLRPEWQRRFGVQVRARMALHSGEVVAGDMGSALKSNYTVLGEPVATAERLERANRLYGTDLLVSGETQRRAGEEFVFRELDVVTLGGGRRRSTSWCAGAARCLSRWSRCSRGGRRRWPVCAVATSPGRWRSSSSTPRWTRCPRAGPSGCAATRRPRRRRSGTGGATCAARADRRLAKLVEAGRGAPVPRGPTDFRDPSCLRRAPAGGRCPPRRGSRTRASRAAAGSASRSADWR